MDKIRVLIITGTMEMGGIENQLMHLIRNADKEKFQIDFTTTAEHPYYQDEIEALGGKCIHIRSAEGRHFIRYCRELYRVMKGNYDVVHSHELFHSGMVLRTAEKAGIKCRFVHAHNWSDSDGTGRQSVIRKIYNRIMRRWILKYGTEFCACSTLAGRFLYGEDITERENYHLIFNSVDTSRFIDNYDRTESGEFCGGGWVNVLQVGRFSAVKNQLFTVKIAAELKRRGDKIRILCAGNNGNDYEAQIRAEIERNGLEEYMVLLGIRPDIDVLARKSSAFLLPSLYEGMPLVLIEAQAAGLQCVAADTFSGEVDFGIGLIRWMQLSSGPAKWADAVEQAAHAARADKSAVVMAVEENGFDSRVFSDRLCGLYEAAVRKA